MNKKQKLAAFVIAPVAALAALACAGPGNDRDAPPRNRDTSSSTETSATRAPVTVTGKGEEVRTVELAKGGYTVKYEADSFCLIASTVNAEGVDDTTVVNACGSNLAGGVSGVDTYKASGPVTLHVWNTDKNWSLTFTPMG